MKLHRHADARMTQMQARTQLVTMLASCTDAALERMTVVGLASIHNLPAREIEYELIVARQKRSAAA
jgi:hypothetical protein